MTVTAPDPVTVAASVCTSAAETTWGCTVIAQARTTIAIALASLRILFTRFPLITLSRSVLRGFTLKTCGCIIAVKT